MLCSYYSITKGMFTTLTQVWFSYYSNSGGVNLLLSLRCWLSLRCRLFTTVRCDSVITLIEVLIIYYSHSGVAYLLLSLRCDSVITLIQVLIIYYSCSGEIQILLSLMGCLFTSLTGCCLFVALIQVFFSHFPHWGIVHLLFSLRCHSGSKITFLCFSYCCHSAVICMTSAADPKPWRSQKSWSPADYNENNVWPIWIAHNDSAGQSVQ